MLQSEPDPQKPLKDLADEIRRRPQLAQEVDVSQLVQDLTGRWRQLHDMIDASEEVPVAAWIVRRKVEGLVRPEPEVDEGAGFDPLLRPEWLDQAVTGLMARWQDAQRFRSRSPEPLPRRQPAPVKDPSVWKILWSYPRLREKPVPPAAEVQRHGRPLAQVMSDLLARLKIRRRLVFHEIMVGRPRDQWTEAFLAAVHLWHEQTVELSQAGPFAPLVLTGALKEGESH